MVMVARSGPDYFDLLEPMSAFDGTASGAALSCFVAGAAVFGSTGGSVLGAGEGAAAFGIEGAEVVGGAPGAL